MTAGSALPTSGATTFAVDRFAWARPDRLELSGRWSGVRGVRFVRPTLVLVAGEEHHRVLALLEHKPWLADDHGHWHAAFPWAGDPFDADLAELTVGPGIVVPLAPPELPPGAARRRGAPAGEPAAVPASGERGVLQRAADADRAVRSFEAERGA